MTHFFEVDSAEAADGARSGVLDDMGMPAGSPPCRE
ncbi:hypothetical protein HNR25_000713 [Streptomonospora salina]|uniref:Uncharacterized protein n=1 Tax=Streptomonospora salina TaxID=104205 RepID=A0A841E2N7_9ACTN|nr:hypothetical protein [Streptomonospora salina]